MSIIKIIKNPYSSLIFNFVYAFCNCAIGFLTHSWWFITVGAYYFVLTVTRFSVLQIQRKNKDPQIDFFAKRITGILFLVLSFCLVGINILSAIKDRGTVFHEIIMIAIATYTFTKITIAIIKLIKSRKLPSPIIKVLRNISFADAVVSIYTLQRSMLVSFPGMAPNEIKTFNILTGSAVWITVFFLGINLIGGRKIDMAKSKLVETNEKIAEAVTSGYKKIEKGVVDGYKKIEQGVVNGYTKVEDKFVESYLTKDGETVEEAKERLKNNK